MINKIVQHRIDTKEIFWFDGKLFLMYYYPQMFFGDKYAKMTFRKLGEITDINYQAIRWAVKNVEKQLQKQYYKK
jgi:hypothetical protein